MTMRDVFRVPCAVTRGARGGTSVGLAAQRALIPHLSAAHESPAIIASLLQNTEHGTRVTSL